MSETQDDLKSGKSGSNSEKPEIDSSILASYNILSELGQGAFGVVYKAEHKSNPGVVALKLVHKDLANSKVAFERLGQDATAITALKHPNVVGVKEFGTGSEGSAYLAMEYVEGSTLNELISKGPVARPLAMDISIKICKALSYAHSKGILHRDLKPQNVILTNKNGDVAEVKVVDFGLAKIRNEVREQNLTQTGDIVGSPYYMSPEQSQGLEFDARSDIYSMGCILYELLTGEVPLKGSSAMATVLKHVNETPKKPSDKAPALAIPKELDELVLKSLEKEPASRYQSADDMQKDLELISAGKAPVGLSNTGANGASAASSGVKKSPAKKEQPLAAVSRVVTIVFVLIILAVVFLFFAKPH